MELYLLRHAIAEDRDPTRWPDDSQRPLTTRGKRRLRLAVQGMKALKLRFDAVLSSPFVRARQTAEIVADRLDFEIIYNEHLGHQGSFEALLTDIQNMHPSPQRLLLVGHEPDLGELASHLLSGISSRFITLKKGGLCRLDVDHLDLRQPRASLGFLLTAAQLRRLA